MGLLYLYCVKEGTIKANFEIARVLKFCLQKKLGRWQYDTIL
jgi:hypothetical protein